MWFVLKVRILIFGKWVQVMWIVPTGILIFISLLPAIFFLSSSLLFFFFQCGWHIKTELNLKLNPLLRMSLNDNPFPWMKQYLYYLKTRAGSFSWALSCSTSFGKFFSMKTFPNEGIPSWVHSFSVEACFSSKTEFSDCITAWTWSNKKKLNNNYNNSRNYTLGSKSVTLRAQE